MTIVLGKLCFYHNASGMCWIDFSHKITLRTMILEEKSKIFIFSLQYKTLISLNQGRGSIFKLWECAQSIPRIKLALIGSFLKKNFGSKKAWKIAKFRFLIHPVIELKIWFFLWFKMITSMPLEFWEEISCRQPKGLHK